MFFDTTNKVTDIIMFNSRNLGALIVDEKPRVKSWDEPQDSIMNLGIEESYGFGVLKEGKAIAVAKNAKEHQIARSTPAGARSSRSIRTTPTSTDSVWSRGSRFMRSRQRQLRPGYSS